MSRTHVHRSNVVTNTRRRIGTYKGKRKSTKKDKKVTLRKKKVIKTAPNIVNTLNNIISTNVKEGNEKKKKMYFSKALKIATNELKRIHDMPLKIAFHSGANINRDLDLPVMKHFKQRNYLNYNHQIVVYYDLPKHLKIHGGNFSRYYDTMNGGLGELEQSMGNTINGIITSMYNHFMAHGFKKNFTNKISIWGDDRFTFRYGMIANKIIYVDIRCLDFFTTNDNIDRSITLGELVFNIQNTTPNPAIIHSFCFGNLKPKMEAKFTQIVKAYHKTGVPLAYLLLSETQQTRNNNSSKSVKDLHIEWGYTFKDARGLGLSTVLRKLIQVYAYDKNINYVSTEAIAWGSQRGSKSAGMFQMPEARKKKVSTILLNNNAQKKIFAPTNNTPKSRRNALLRKAVYTKTNYTPQKQKDFISRYFGGGRIPLSAYGTGKRLNYHEQNGIFGTHVRKVKGREEIPKGMTTRGGRHSLYPPM